MKKYLLAIAASLILAQAALADDPATGADNQTICPDAATLQKTTFRSVSTDAITNPARYNGKLSDATSTYMATSQWDGGKPYQTTATWTPYVNGVKANSVQDAITKMNAILSHISGNGQFKALSSTNVACEYTIATEDLADYENEINKPVVIATAYIYNLGNYAVRQ